MHVFMCFLSGSSNSLHEKLFWALDIRSSENEKFTGPNEFLVDQKEHKKSH